MVERLERALLDTSVVIDLDQIPADARVISQIAPILADLDSDRATTRDAAMESLRRIGRPAVLKSTRMG